MKAKRKCIFFCWTFFIDFFVFFKTKIRVQHTAESTQILEQPKYVKTLFWIHISGKSFKNSENKFHRRGATE